MSTFFGGVSEREFSEFKSEVNGFLSEFREAIPNLNKKLDSVIKLVEINKNEIDNLKVTAPVADSEARIFLDKIHSIHNDVSGTKNQLLDALEEIELCKNKVLNSSMEVDSLKSSIFDSKNSIQSIYDSSVNSLNEILNQKNESVIALSEVNGVRNEFHKYVEEAKSLPDKLSEILEMLEKCNVIGKNISSVRDNVIKQRTEISDLHKEIFGSEVENSSGEVERIPGRKDELDHSYNDLKKEIKIFKDEYKSTIQIFHEKFDDAINVKKKDFDDLLVASTRRFETVDEQLKGLLPGALAAGLSAAFEEKKEEEEDSLKQFESSFKYAIWGMVSISAIPLIVNLYLFLVVGVDLAKVIHDTPSLLAAVLPLYFPILWFAYSANKKSNLSKRLIEEYTHKSVLGKTYSGLANQIEVLQQHGDLKDELRTKLLFNVLQVSAENPGKLITNYSKADHPLMDALENSAKLADSVSALAKIPGFSALASKLAKKADDLLEDGTKKVVSGLEVQEVLEAGSEKVDGDKKEENK